MDVHNQEQPGPQPEGGPLKPDAFSAAPSNVRRAMAGILLPMVWCVVVSGVGLIGLGVAPVFVAVAVYAAGRRTVLAAALAGFAGVCVFITVGDPVDALFATLVPAGGLFLGVGFVRNWAYGRSVILAVTAVFLVNAAFLAYSRESIEESSNRLLSMVRARLEVLDEGPAPEDEQAGSREEPREDKMPRPSEESRGVLELYAWFLEEWPSTLLGSMLVSIAAGICATLSGTSWWLRRRYRLQGPRGSFLTMRTPDWLVWLVIGVAIVWFADRRWPGTVLKPLSWNAAIGLAGVYWLNGLSLLLYAAKVLKATPIVIGLVAAGIMCSGMQTVALIGLFDTWVGFRAKANALAAATKNGDDSRTHEA